MIRDPSDGSVRELRKFETGVPVTKETAEEAARLKRSREWLADYLKKRKPVAI